MASYYKRVMCAILTCFYKKNTTKRAIGRLHSTSVVTLVELTLFSVTIVRCHPCCHVWLGISSARICHVNRSLKHGNRVAHSCG